MLRDLAELLGRRDYVSEGIAILEKHLSASGMSNADERAQMLADFADRHSDLDKLRTKADAGDHQAAAELTGILLALRDVDALRAEARAGTEWSLYQLIEALVAQGRQEEADEVHRYGFSADE